MDVDTSYDCDTLGFLFYVKDNDSASITSDDNISEFFMIKIAIFKVGNRRFVLQFSKTERLMLVAFNDGGLDLP